MASCSADISVSEKRPAADKYFLIHPERFPGVLLRDVKAMPQATTSFHRGRAAGSQVEGCSPPIF
jgi:hypothetical protein